jgi:hypothetical protein
MPENLMVSETGLDPGTKRLCNVGQEEGFSVHSMMVLRMQPPHNILGKGV